MSVSVPTSLSVFVLGTLGVGKSTFGNTLVGNQQNTDEEFATSDGIKSCTQGVRTRTGNNITVVDTPGEGDPKLTGEAWKTILTGGLGEQKFDVIIVIIKANKGGRVDVRDVSQTVLSLVFNEKDVIDIDNVFFVFSDPHAQAEQHHIDSFVKELFTNGGLTEKLATYNVTNHCALWDLKENVDPNHRFHINSTVKKLNAFAGQQKVKIVKVEDKKGLKKLFEKLNPFKQFMSDGVKEGVEELEKVVEESSK